MKQSKYIQTRLIEKNINQYKIIEKQEKSFFYKDVFNKISYDIISADRILVVFKINNGIARFEASSCDSQEIIDSLIEQCIENTSYMQVKWHNDDFENVKITESDACKNFQNFDPHSYINWLKQGIDKVKNKTKLELNTIYNINIYKFSLLTNLNYLEQYYMNSECISAENKAFEKRAMIYNKYLGDELFSVIIDELNKEPIVFKNIDLQEQKNILIKSGALAKLLDVYINFFYANLVYLKQSFIQRDDIGKQIFKHSFSLISLPHDGMYFDAEGSKMIEKKIVEDGTLVNLLSNNYMSGYLGIESYGDASHIKSNNISYQRLKFILPNNKNYNMQEINLTIHKFENVYLDFSSQTVEAMALCSDESGIYNSMITLSAKEIFDKMHAISNEGEWHENIYCQDIILVK